MYVCVIILCILQRYVSVFIIIICLYHHYISVRVIITYLYVSSLLSACRLAMLHM